VPTRRGRWRFGLVAPICRHGYRPRDVAAHDETRRNARRTTAGRPPDPWGADNYGVEIIRARHRSPTSGRAFVLVRQGFCCCASA